MDWIDVLCIGGGLLWIWIAFKFSSFENNSWRFLNVFHRPHIWWPVCTTIVIVTIVCACLAGDGKRKEPTNSDLMAEIQTVHAKLQDAARNVERTREDELRTKYPFGYIIVAFSGQMSAMLFRMDRFELKPNDIELAISQDNRELQIRVPDMTDTHFHNTISGCYLYLPMFAGARSMDIPTGDAHIQAEYLEDDSIGRYVVLGFADEQRPHIFNKQDI